MKKSISRASKASVMKTTKQQNSSQRNFMTSYNCGNENWTNRLGRKAGNQQNSTLFLILAVSTTFLL